MHELVHEPECLANTKESPETNNWSSDRARACCSQASPSARAPQAAGERPRKSSASQAEGMTAVRSKGNPSFPRRIVGGPGWDYFRAWDYFRVGLSQKWSQQLLQELPARARAKEALISHAYDQATCGIFLQDSLLGPPTQAGLAPDWQDRSDPQGGAGPRRRQQRGGKGPCVFRRRQARLRGARYCA